MSQDRPSLNILVADRDESVSKTLRENLVGMGHRVTVVDTGEAALQAVQTKQYNAAILDVVFPDQMDGYEILKWIRENEDTQSMWVGLTSEVADRFRKGSGLPVQPDEWVSKPVKAEEIAGWNLA